MFSYQVWANHFPFSEIEFNSLLFVTFPAVCDRLLVLKENGGWLAREGEGLVSWVLESSILALSVLSLDEVGSRMADIQMDDFGMLDMVDMAIGYGMVDMGMVGTGMVV